MRYSENGFSKYKTLEGEYKSYAEAVRHFGGEQDWYDKKAHRFTIKGDRNLYLMSKQNNENK